ncbi:hypothetical protein OIU78_006185 [Salix suchowensis]|nr:hypothetical protein OIU78_006185 [Salix suchowensis]
MVLAYCRPHLRCRGHYSQPVEVEEEGREEVVVVVLVQDSGQVTVPDTDRGAVKDMVLVGMEEVEAKAVVEEAAGGGGSGSGSAMGPVAARAMGPVLVLV